MYRVYFFPCWILLFSFLKSYLFFQCWSSFIFVLIRHLHLYIALSHTGTWSQEGKAEPLYTKPTLVTHCPHIPEAQSWFLRNWARASLASSGLREFFHDIDHLEEDVFITDIINCMETHTCNLDPVTLITEIYKCQPFHGCYMMLESHCLMMSWQQSWHKVSSGCPFNLYQVPQIQAK